MRTAAGSTGPELWSALTGGRTLAGPVTLADAGGLPSRIACEVRELQPDDGLADAGMGHLDRAARLGVAAAAAAVASAGRHGHRNDRCGVVTATSTGGVAVVAGGAPDRAIVVPDATAAVVALRTGWSGMARSVVAACAGGTQAVGEAARAIAEGRADLVVAGGYDAPVRRSCLAGFAGMGVLSRRNDAPELASRPFDDDRDGFVLAEGAAFLALEELGAARARGATVLARVAGYATVTADASRRSARGPAGAGEQACLVAALADARLSPGDIVHVNAHGTGERRRDRLEADVVAAVLGEEVPVTSTKGVTGHPLAAAGPLQAISVVLSFERAQVPPTANCDRVDPEVHVDVVARSPRPFAPGPVVANAFGFGGHSGCLVLVPGA